MTDSSWRTIAIVLGVACVVLGWRGCRPRPAAPPTAERCAELAERRGDGGADLSFRGGDGRRAAEDDGDDDGEGGDGGGDAFGFRIPSWVAWLAPHPGEDLLSYRDRLVPLAQAAVAPQRARVGRGRDDFATIAGLDARQKAELDAAVQEAATAIQDRVLSAALGGELLPSSFKPMTGVTLARDVLDQIDHANQRFLSTLREDQRAVLARHPFDLADYLLFSTRWEDALGATE
jgi:hypothetical protein